jgi:hypothetical protein
VSSHYERHGRHISEIYPGYQSLHEAPVGPLNCDPFTIPYCHLDFRDQYRGKASIRFPTLTKDSEMYGGQLYRGCRYAFGRVYEQHTLPPSFAKLGDSVDEIPRRLKAMGNRFWSKDGFLEHIKDCVGVRWLLNEK